VWLHSRALLDACLVATVACVVLVHGYALWKRLRLLAVFAICLPSLIAAGALAWFFVIGDTDTVRQYAAGDAAREARWSAWFAVWPALLLGLGIAGSAQCMGLLFASLDRATWRWVPVLLLCSLTSALGFFTVFAWFPDV